MPGQGEGPPTCHKHNELHNDRVVMEEGTCKAKRMDASGILAITRHGIMEDSRHSRRNKHARSMYRLRRRHTAPFCVHEGNPLAYRPSSRTGSMSGQPVRPTRPCLYWRPCRLLYALP